MASARAVPLGIASTPGAPTMRCILQIKPFKSVETIRGRSTIERLWRDLKDRLAWVLVTQLAELERFVKTIIRQYAKTALRSLTSYPCECAVARRGRTAAIVWASLRAWMTTV